MTQDQRRGQAGARALRVPLLARGVCRRTGADRLLMYPPYLYYPCVSGVSSSASMGRVLPINVEGEQILKVRRGIHQSENGPMNSLTSRVLRGCQATGRFPVLYTLSQPVIGCHRDYPIQRMLSNGGNGLGSFLLPDGRHEPEGR